MLGMNDDIEHLNNAYSSMQAFMHQKSQMVPDDFAYDEHEKEIPGYPSRR